MNVLLGEIVRRIAAVERALLSTLPNDSKARADIVKARQAFLVAAEDLMIYTEGLL